MNPSSHEPTRPSVAAPARAGSLLEGGDVASVLNKALKDVASAIVTDAVLAQPATRKHQAPRRHRPWRRRTHTHSSGSVCAFAHATNRRCASSRPRTRARQEAGSPQTRSRPGGHRRCAGRCCSGWPHTPRRAQPGGGESQPSSARIVRLGQGRVRWEPSGVARVPHRSLVRERPNLPMPSIIDSTPPIQSVLVEALMAGHAGRAPHHRDAGPITLSVYGSACVTGGQCALDALKRRNVDAVLEDGRDVVHARQAVLGDAEIAQPRKRHRVRPRKRSSRTSVSTRQPTTAYAHGPTPRARRRVT